MTTIKIRGMSCQHCVMAVKKALSGIAGVQNVDVDLASGEASLYTNQPIDLLPSRKESRKRATKLSETSWHIQGMTCAACVRRVEQGIAVLPGVRRAEVNIATEKAKVDYDELVLSPETIREAISGAWL